jgi:hypothetical protein
MDATPGPGIARRPSPASPMADGGRSAVLSVVLTLSRIALLLGIAAWLLLGSSTRAARPSVRRRIATLTLLAAILLALAWGLP